LNYEITASLIGEQTDSRIRNAVRFHHNDKWKRSLQTVPANYFICETQAQGNDSQTNSIYIENETANITFNQTTLAKSNDLSSSKCTSTFRGSYQN